MFFLAPSVATFVLLLGFVAALFLRRFSYARRLPRNIANLRNKMFSEIVAKPVLILSGNRQPLRLTSDKHWSGSLVDCVSDSLLRELVRVSIQIVVT